MYFNSIEEIVSSLKKGEIVIMLDDEREHEGDMIVAAEFATPNNIAFMMKYGCGIICTPISYEIAQKFDLSLLPRRDCNDLMSCFNTVSFDTKNSSGISAIERSKSIMILASDDASYFDIQTPGHVFPLIANQEGVLGRPGHTETAIDLMKLCKLKNAAALVEVMNDDKDKLATQSELIQFAAQHKLKISTIRNLIEYITINR